MDKLDKKISEIFDYGDEIAIVEERDDLFDPARIKELTMKKIEKESITPVSRPKAARKMRPVYRTILIAAIIAALLLGTAVAFTISHSFYQSAFGTKGLENVEGGKSGDDVYPAMEFVEADEEKAEEILGDYVVSDSMSVEAGDYIFTVDDYFFDENGFGAISYTLRRADGGAIPGYRMWDEQFDYGGFVLDWEWHLMGPLLEVNSEWTSLSGMQILDKEQTTKTQLHAVYYIDSLPEDLKDDRILAYMDIREERWNEFTGEMHATEVSIGESERIALSTENRVPTTTFTNGSYNLEISPLSMVIRCPFAREAGASGEEYYQKNITIHYVDGSEYEVMKAEPYTANTIDGAYSGSRDCYFYIFNRLVDVDNIVSITTDGMGDASGEYVRAE